MSVDLIEVHGELFHPIWLRDNCLCLECRHAWTFWKTVDISRSYALSSIVREVDLNQESLVVLWDEEPEHRSVFPLEWLSAHAYGRQRITPRLVHDHALWDAGTWIGASPPSYGLADCTPDGGAWAEDLARHGFVFLDGATEDLMEQFASQIGPVQPTEFGRSIAVQAAPEANHPVKSGNELTPHTDFSTYLNVAPLLQFMLFIKNDAAGGDSILVDGFMVAERFREEHPAHFERLTRTPINFQQVYPDWEYFLARRRKIIELDRDGNIEGVFFHHSHTCNWDLPPEETDAFYRAYFLFFDYLRSPEFQLRMHTPAGRCIALQNGRILHGRAPYDPSSGGRALIDSYVPWEYFEARLRYRKFKDFYPAAGEMYNGSGLGARAA